MSPTLKAATTAMVLAVASCGAHRTTPRIGDVEDVGTSAKAEREAPAASQHSTCERTRARVVELSAGASFTCARFSDNTVKCWGSNQNGELGQGDTRPRHTISELPAIPLPSQVLRSIRSSGGHSCVLTGAGQVGCWGNNFEGVLGVETSGALGDDPDEMGVSFSFVDLGSKGECADVSVGAGHVCALLISGSLKCWGWNEDGQLGLGDRRSRGAKKADLGEALPTVDVGRGRLVKGVSVGQKHTCAILDDDTLKCWGDNEFGQLGLGDTRSRGGAPVEMGDALPRVDLGSSRTVRSVAASDQHTCALLDDDSVKCWGAGFSGALGQGSSKTIGTRAGQMGNRLLPIAVSGSSRPKQVFAAGLHSCLTFEDGALKCWGSNSYGVLGLGDHSDRGLFPVEMGAGLPAVSVGTGRKIQSIATSLLHTCVLLQDSSVKCWGKGEDGALGHGDTLDRGTKPDDMGDNLPVLDFGSGCDDGASSPR
jgi:E3 ubiquitin-protein ligase HERC3